MIQATSNATKQTTLSSNWPINFESIPHSLSSHANPHSLIQEVMSRIVP